MSVLGELGRQDLYFSRLVSIIKYWLRQTELLFRFVQSTSSKHIHININCQRNKTVYNIVELVINKHLIVLRAIQ